MEFDFSNAFDGKRLTNRMRASVQSNGNLNFPPDVVRHMGLSLESSLLICPMGEKDLAVTVVGKDDERGFTIRKTGPYYYVPFRSLLSESGIDCTKVRVVYDIIERKECYEGHPVFKFNRRIIEHRAERVEKVEGGEKIKVEGRGREGGEKVEVEGRGREGGDKVEVGGRGREGAEISRGDRGEGVEGVEGVGGEGSAT